VIEKSHYIKSCIFKEMLFDSESHKFQVAMHALLPAESNKSKKSNKKSKKSKKSKEKEKWSKVVSHLQKDEQKVKHDLRNILTKSPIGSAGQLAAAAKMGSSFIGPVSNLQESTASFAQALKKNKITRKKSIDPQLFYNIVLSTVKCENDELYKELLSDKESAMEMKQVVNTLMSAHDEYIHRSWTSRAKGFFSNVFNWTAWAFKSLRTVLRKITKVVLQLAIVAIAIYMLACAFAHWSGLQTFNGYPIGQIGSETEPLGGATSNQGIFNKVKKGVNGGWLSDQIYMEWIGEGACAFAHSTWLTVRNIIWSWSGMNDDFIMGRASPYYHMAVSKELSAKGTASGKAATIAGDMLKCTGAAYAASAVISVLSSGAAAPLAMTLGPWVCGASTVFAGGGLAMETSGQIDSIYIDARRDEMNWFFANAGYKGGLMWILWAVDQCMEYVYNVKDVTQGLQSTLKKMEPYRRKVSNGIYRYKKLQSKFKQSIGNILHQNGIQTLQKLTAENIESFTQILQGKVNKEKANYKIAKSEYGQAASPASFIAIDSLNSTFLTLKSNKQKLDFMKSFVNNPAAVGKANTLAQTQINQFVLK
jgi:hypothetical protein